MEYRTLGRSGCAVSTIALGTMTFGAETDEAGSRDQLDAYVEAGGNLIDIADVYAAGVSEELVGRWLAAQPSRKRDTVVLATKGRFPMGPDVNDVGLSRRHLQHALDNSLRRLGVDCVDLYQVHAWDPVTPLIETMQTLDDMVRAGKVRYVGLSNFTGWQVQKAVAVAAAAASSSRSPCSRSTTCWSARSSGKSWRPARTPVSGYCRGLRWAVVG